MMKILKAATSAKQQKQAKQDATATQVKQDLSAAFEKPAEYIKGELKRLRDFHSDEWWLNVDYVDSHSIC